MKGTKRTSAVWADFVLNKNKQDLKAKCIHCGHIYSAKTKGGTGHLLRHQEICPARNVDERQPSISQFIQKSNPLPFTYSYDDDRLSMSRMVVQTEQSFLYVEGRPFNRYKSSVQPEHKITGRKTVRSDALKQYIQRKAMLISEFASLSCKVNLTSDCWDSGVEYYYICVTAHWVDDEWNLQKTYYWLSTYGISS
ncbi:hypothetical protein RND81_09G095000 [Saponaria officinalis]|uniref:BED-type domain-containing protein n=1 Tax=Saponaria officinalis TaxID=3572 RepID=A0AAW1IK11_SAPOF